MSVNFKSQAIEKHRELADSIKSNLVVDGTTIKETESHAAYYANLPEGITQKEVESLSKYSATDRDWETP